MAGLKESKQAQGAEMIANLPDFAPPTILAQASRLDFSNRFYHLLVANVPGPPLPTRLGRQGGTTCRAAQEEGGFLVEHMQVCACNTCWAAGTWARRLLLLCLLPAAAGAALACINDMGRLHARTRHPCAQRRFTG